MNLRGVLSKPKINKSSLFLTLFTVVMGVFIVFDYTQRANKQKEYKNADSTYDGGSAQNYRKDNLEHRAGLNIEGTDTADKDKIIAQYLAEFEKNQPLAAVYSQEGFQLKREHKFEEAEEKFKKAIELNPLEYQPYLGLMEIYRFYMKDKAESIPSLLMAPLQYDPRNIIFLRALAQHYEGVENYVEARRWYGKIIEFYPTDAPAQQKFDEMEGYLQYRRSWQ